MTLLGSSTTSAPAAGCPNVSRRYSAPLSVACRSRDDACEWLPARLLLPLRLRWELLPCAPCADVNLEEKAAKTLHPHPAKSIVGLNRLKMSRLSTCHVIDLQHEHPGSGRPCAAFKVMAEWFADALRLCR